MVSECKMFRTVPVSCLVLNKHRLLLFLLLLRQLSHHVSEEMSGVETQG